MDLRQLAYVAAVVDHGGFTRAAEAMHVAQPSLSQSVRSLERELGAELFHRTPRQVVLTAAGEALLGPARQALRDADTARAAVAAVAGLEAGHLDLVSLPTLAVHPAAALIGRFRRAHPQVSVRLVEPEEPDEVARHVRTGASELGFAELPVDDEGLEEVSLGTEEYVALLPADLEPTLTRGGRLPLAVLADQPLITTPAGTSSRRLLDEHVTAAGFTPTVAVETEHREAIGPLVTAGAGVAIVPRVLAEAATSRVVVLREVTPPIRRRLGIVHRRGLLSPAAEAFLGLAREPG